MRAPKPRFNPQASSALAAFTRLRPAYDGATLAAEHTALLDDLEHGVGPEALRAHIEASTQALLSAMR